MSRSKSPTTDETEWVEWASTGRPHGLKGELRLFIHNADSPNELDLSRVRISVDQRVVETRVTSLRPGPKGAIVRFEAVDGRDQAEAWRNARVEVPASVFPPLDDDEWYAFELEGLVASTAEGRRVGVVETLTDFGAGPLLAIRTGRDVEFLPFAEPYVGDIDMDAGTIIVDPSDFESA